MRKLSDSRGTGIDTDKCVTNAGENRFDLVLIAAARSREIKRHNQESTKREHIFPIITALEEIQEGKIGKEYLKRVK
jgi:DNA-directed RNA polymerase omega subunit